MSPKLAGNTTYQLTILTPSAAATVECPNLIRGYARDTILTDALRKPSVLNGADRTAFWEQYERVVIDAEHNEHPKAAILIHLEDDPVVARVFHVLGSIFSLTAALVAHFAMSDLGSGPSAYVEVLVKYRWNVPNVFCLHRVLVR